MIVGNQMGENVIHGRFEWDKEKEAINIKKHGISFEEILPMFDDPLFWEKEDFTHSSLDETRYIGTAKVNGFSVIISCYTERERIRIISARASTKEEEKFYEQWCKQFYS